MTVGLDRYMYVGLGEEGKLMEIMEEHGVGVSLDVGREVIWAILDELPLVTRLGAYSLWQRRQYLSILRHNSLLEMIL